jgi:hypothetical protein
MSDCVSRYEYNRARKGSDSWQKLAESRLRLLQKKNKEIRQLKRDADDRRTFD